MCVCVYKELLLVWNWCWGVPNKRQDAHVRRIAQRISRVVHLPQYLVRVGVQGCIVLCDQDIGHKDGVERHITAA